MSETGRLYIFTGAGWYNIALINTNPVITSGGESFYSLSIDGTPTVITLVANDPEDVPISWSYAVTTGSLTNGGGTSGIVTQADNVFTITPTTTEAYAGDFEITFTASDGVNLATSASTFSLSWGTPTEYLIVAGGGGGGSVNAGGGGGGYAQTGTVSLITSTTYNITVGAGGGPIANGGNSSIAGTNIATILSLGGGNGGGGIGGNGGTGGGGQGGANAGGIGSQGGNGGFGPSVSGQNPGGGGGGTTGNGADGVSGLAGAGGTGISSSISGTLITYGGGGGGGIQQSGVGGAGNDGGGNGGTGPSSTGAAGSSNRGGGGGGGGGSSPGTGGSGGSGVVILRYPDTNPAATSTTGSPNITVAGGYRVYKFTQSGTITF